MRLRRGISIAVVAAGGVVTTMLVGLVTNAVSESKWPGWLGWHTWFSFVLLGGLLVVMTVLAALSDSWTPMRQPESAPQNEAEPPGAAFVLWALPRDTAAFTDRGAELTALVGSVRAAQESGEALPVHVIDGMPGVGKTAFAAYAGHVLAEQFPDGQLFVNLNGHTTGRSPVQAGEALASLLVATGVSAGRIPAGDDLVTVVVPILRRGRRTGVSIG